MCQTSLIPCNAYSWMFFRWSRRFHLPGVAGAGVLCKKWFPGMRVLVWRSCKRRGGPIRVAAPREPLLHGGGCHGRYHRAFAVHLVLLVRSGGSGHFHARPGKLDGREGCKNSAATSHCLEPYRANVGQTLLACVTKTTCRRPIYAQIV